MNTKELAEKYPKLFEECGGASVCNGWIPLIDKLCQDILAMPGGDKVRVVQWKEKLAGLRFYVSGASREISDLIHKVENETFKICEFCGGEGKSAKRKSGWYKTICDQTSNHCKWSKAWINETLNWKEYEKENGT